MKLDFHFMLEKPHYRMILGHPDTGEAAKFPAEESKAMTWCYPFVSKPGMEVEMIIRPGVRKRGD